MYQDIEIPTSPTKKNLSEEKCQGLGSRKALFSTKGRQLKSSKAVMSVARVLRMKDGLYSGRVGVSGAVYLASVLEYLVAEVLEQAWPGLAPACLCLFEPLQTIAAYLCVHLGRL